MQTNKYNINLTQLLDDAEALKSNAVSFLVPNTNALSGDAVLRFKRLLYDKNNELKPRDKFDYSNSENQEYYTRMDSGGDAPVMGLLGKPVFCDLILESQDGLIKLQLIDVLCTVDASKNIIKTALTKRKGTVKEYISMGDYSVNFYGRITDPIPTKYPVESVGLLKRLLELPESLTVTSEFLQLWGIYNIAIDGYGCPQREGFQNVQEFDVRASSDEAIELEEVEI